MKYRKKILSIIVLMGLTFGLYFVYLFGKTFFWDNTIFEEPKVYVYINDGDDFSKVISTMTPLVIFSLIWHSSNHWISSSISFKGAGPEAVPPKPFMGDPSGRISE